MKVVYDDGSWFVGKRGRKEMGFPNHESMGCHHFTVIDGDGPFRAFIGDEIAVPINNVKFFVLNYK